MDTRLLKFYERELSYLREMGTEFARSYPKVAARLGIEDVEVLDPYVERLLEGVAFLTARVQLEQDLQYPAFTSHLLETVYPHYLGPVPSVMIAKLNPDMDFSGLAEGHPIPRHTRIRSKTIEGTQSSCVFLTGHDTTLWPVVISEAEYIDNRGALVAAGVAVQDSARAAIRLRIKRHGGQPLSDLDLDRLALFMGSASLPGWKAYEAMALDSVGVVARAASSKATWTVPLAEGIAQRGFGREDALLPLPAASFDGYRLLQEYFILPERFHFVDIRGLAPAIMRCSDDEMDIYVLLRSSDSEFVTSLDKEAFHLNCVPAVNLFEKRCDRVQITTQDYEQHVVPERTAPLDYEVHTVLDVMGIGGDGVANTPFRSFYSIDDRAVSSQSAPAFYSTARRLRQRTERELVRGTRTNYLGAEVFLSLVDRKEAPYSSDLKQLAVRALVTNRDLPMMLPMGDPQLFHLPDGGPVSSISTLVTPTRPRPSFAQGETAWRIISHLSLNYLSITDTDGGSGAQALKTLLGLYGPREDPATLRMLDGIASVSTRPIVRKMTDEVISTAVRGTEITLELDEDFFEGTSPFLLAALLEVFFRNHTTINSFTETVLVTKQRGELKRWRPRIGVGRTV